MTRETFYVLEFSMPSTATGANTFTVSSSKSPLEDLRGPKAAPEGAPTPLAQMDCDLVLRAALEDNSNMLIHGQHGGMASASTPEGQWTKPRFGDYYEPLLAGFLHSTLEQKDIVINQVAAAVPAAREYFRRHGYQLNEG